MKPVTFCLLFGLVVFGFTHISPGQEAARVGSLGNPAHFAFEGVVLSPGALWISRDVFAEDTWPWAFSRSSAFLLAGKQDLASEGFKKLLESPGTGPVGCLSIAAAMNYLHPAARRVFADEGLLRLNLRSFRRDDQGLLQGDAPIGRVAVRYVELLREMPVDELRQLARHFAGGQTDSPLEQALLRLAQSRDQPPRVSLSKLLDELWEPVLMPKVKQWLNTLVEVGVIRSAQFEHRPAGTAE